jgi:aryl-phospho-beta-D-glucosidase BglC (GH1 family)
LYTPELYSQEAKTKSTAQAGDLEVFCSGLKGFNLLGKFDVSWTNNGYSEEEFILINQLGFNFVRLPVDYRTYTSPGDWYDFIESEIEEIDDAIDWGGQYDVHVCINLHRAPGYCVNPATLPVSQQLDLWTNPEAQQAFVDHWGYFANRYKDIAPEVLSFNLVNEPSNVNEAAYLAVMMKAIDTIHSITPGRIVFVDGLNYARDLIPALKDVPNVAQSMHCYDPFGITHYKAEWVNGSSDMPVPRWPMLPISNYLYGPWKSEYKSSLVVEGNFPAGTEITVNVRQVSIESNLAIKAGTQTILSKKFVCGADTGNDFSKVLLTEWGYQNISNKDFSVQTTTDAVKISIENTSGDWMTINSFSFKIDGILCTFIPADDTWGKKQATYKLDAGGKITAADGGEIPLFESYRKNIDIAKANNIAFMVQEFGVYNKTPHAVTIAFLTDLAAFFRANNIGWALWNFTGSFGILDSDRSDCDYESFEGHELDRDMLDALTREISSISELDDNELWQVFPVPAKDQVCLLTGALEGKINLSIHDLRGRRLRDFSAISAPSVPIHIGLSDLEPGMYLIRLDNGEFLGSRIIIVR